jgi:hypothetical protein
VIGARVTLRAFSHAFFLKTCYKLGNFVHYYSYDWIPQSVLYGAISVAASTLGLPTSNVDALHITSATPNCNVCRGPTFFTKPGVAECPDGHGAARPRHADLPKVQKNRQSGGLWIWGSDGNGGWIVKPDRRAAPRILHAIEADSTFSFLAYAEDEDAYSCLEKALKVICASVNNEEGAYMGLGKYKGHMGVFAATVKRFRVREVNVEDFGRAQSPMPYAVSNWKASEDSALTFTQIRHIHYKPDRITVKALIEGSGVQWRGKAYTTDVPSVTVAFHGECVRRVMALKRPKAVEPVVAFGLNVAKGSFKLSPLTAPATHPVVQEARAKAFEELAPFYAELSGRALVERLKPPAEELATLLSAVGVKGYNWKEIAEALAGMQPNKSSGKTCIFCGAPAKFITNLHRVSSAFLPPPKEKGMWVFDPTAVTADFWVNGPQTSKNHYGVCPSCLYALARWKPAVRREVKAAARA